MREALNYAGPALFGSFWVGAMVWSVTSPSLGIAAGFSLLSILMALVGIMIRLNAIINAVLNQK